MVASPSAAPCPPWITSHGVHGHEKHWVMHLQVSWGHPTPVGMVLEGSCQTQGFVGVR